ncbi:MAG: hypothetical protein LBL01_03975 [Bifidobacteriaceae bacterium]|jgi:hypothetical protein|nr:hypothetical protein [Bifidobacteriaceae bacterium]
MTAKKRVALVTCREFPELDAYDAVLPPRLASFGIEALPAVWDDPAVDWDRFDLAVVRSTWDYAARRDEFLAWARSVPRLANPAPVLEWNTDKHYLKDLELRGVPVVPTTWLEPARGLDARGLHTRMPALGDFVLKPAVAAGSIGAGRYTANDSQLRGRAIAYALRLMAAGETVMLQRYLPAVDTVGEVSMVFLDGAYAYAVRKEAMLKGPEQGEDRLYQAERLEGGYDPSPEERAVGAAAVTAALDAVAALGTGPSAHERGSAGESARGGEAEPGANYVRPFLYARADLIRGADAAPVLLALELTEPSLFPELAPGGIEQVCRAIAGRLSPV